MAHERTKKSIVFYLFFCSLWSVIPSFNVHVLGVSFPFSAGVGFNDEHNNAAYANGELVARKDSVGMHYYRGDQLESTSLITDASGIVRRK
jgi:hypothetical protein